MLKIVLIALLVLEAVCVPLFLKYYWPKRCKKSFIMKTVSSIVFISIAVVCKFMAGNGTQYATYIILGLIFGMLGDVLLHWLKGTIPTFGGGVILFLVGHIFYINAFDKAIEASHAGGCVAATTAKTVMLVIGALAIVAITALLIVKKVFKGKEYYIIAAIIYGAVLFSMLAKAVECAVVLAEFYEPGVAPVLGGLEEWQVAMAAVLGGSILFVISDLLLGFMIQREHGKRQKEPVKILRIINIYTYYIAQVIFGLSILVIPFGIG